MTWGTIITVGLAAWIAGDIAVLLCVERATATFDEYFDRIDGQSQ